MVFKKLIIILWSTALTDLSTVARMQELLDPKAKQPLERNILFLKMLDYSTYIFLSALVGVENLFNFSRERLQKLSNWQLIYIIQRRIPK